MANFIEVRSEYQLLENENVKRTDRVSHGCVNVKWSKSRLAEGSRKTYFHYQVSEGVKSVKGINSGNGSIIEFQIRKGANFSYNNVYDLYHTGNWGYGN